MSYGSLCSCMVDELIAVHRIESIRSFNHSFVLSIIRSLWLSFLLRFLPCYIKRFGILRDPNHSSPTQSNLPRSTASPYLLDLSLLFLSPRFPPLILTYTRILPRHIRQSRQSTFSVFSPTLTLNVPIVTSTFAFLVPT